MVLESKQFCTNSPISIETNRVISETEVSLVMGHIEGEERMHPFLGLFAGVMYDKHKSRSVGLSRSLEPT